MMRISKRGWRAVLAACLAGILMATPVAAQTVVTEALYVLNQEDNTLILKYMGDPEQPTFWEAPAVVTGQSMTGGKLKVKNNTRRTVDIRVSHIELPYDNKEALEYLDSVTLTVKQFGQVIYSRPYTRVNDSDGLQLTFSAMKPGEELEVELGISCAYDYKGEKPPFQSIVWSFDVVDIPPSTTTPPPEPNVPLDPDLIRLLLICVAGGALTAAILGIAIKRRRMGRSNLHLR